jgi:hypothetical protein
VVAVLAWGHSSLSNILNEVLLTSVLSLLIGLPLVAAGRLAAGWPRAHGDLQAAA